MHIVVCYPFLDLRFLIDPREAPLPPGWPHGKFGTVGSLGPVIAEARDGREAEIRANAAILFPSEYKRAPKRRVRRWKESPAISNGVTVSGRRLLADTDGQVRVEITLYVSTEEPGVLDDFLDTLVATPVEVVRSGQNELVSAGFRLAQVYLRQSAKTAEGRVSELLDILVREGAGSPFLVVLRRGAPSGNGDGVALDPPNREFPHVTCGLMELAGHTLGVWQIWQAGEVRNWLSHVRDLCRIVSYLSEVTLLLDLRQDAAAMTPYLLNTAATEWFLRERAGQLRRRWRGSWPVRAVNALAAQHLKVAIDEDATFFNGLKGLRGDLKGDLGHSFNIIQGDARERPIMKNTMKHADQELLVRILVSAAVNSGDSEIYFKKLIQQANLPTDFKFQMQQFPGPADYDARKIINWAMGKDVNPNDPRYTTLGSILEPELRQVGLETASAFSVVIIVYKLFRDSRLIDDVRTRFQVPLPARGKPLETRELGPEINWRGPDDDIELQSWLKPEPFLDVGFLKNAVMRSTSVCLVTVGATGRTGTGVLLDSDLVLTNYHVLFPDGVGLSTEQIAPTVSLGFGLFTSRANGAGAFYREAR